MKNIFCGLALFLSAFVGLAAAPTVLQNGAVVSNGLRVATGVITGNASGVSNIPGNKVDMTTGGGITAFTNPSGQVQFYIDPAVLSNGVSGGIGAVNPNQFTTNASVLALKDGGTLPPMNSASLTNLNPTNLTVGGSLPALNAAALTNVQSANVAASVAGVMPSPGGPSGNAIRVIHMDDYGDVYNDDQAALTFGFALQDDGLIQIVATPTDSPSNHWWTVPVAEAICRYYGHPEILQGKTSPRLTSPNGGGYDDGTVAAHWTNFLHQYPHTINGTSNAPSALASVRTILAQSPSNSVSIILGGAFSTMYDLYNSGPDSISPLYGTQLVARACLTDGRGIIASSGEYPNTTTNVLQNWGWDFAAACVMTQSWPVLVTFVTATNSYGGAVTCPTVGRAGLARTQTDVWRFILDMPGTPPAEPPWTELCYLYAVAGTNSGSPWNTNLFGAVRGTLQLSSTGSDITNGWVAGASGPHQYLTFSQTDAYYTNIIEPYFGRPAARGQQPLAQAFPTWTPAQLSQLQVWYLARSNIVANGTAATSIFDSSGRHFNATATAATAPLFTTNGLAGQPAWWFTNQFFVTPVSVPAPPVSFYAIVQSTNLTPRNVLLGVDSINNGMEWEINGGNQMFVKQNVAVVGTDSAIQTANIWHALVMSYDASGGLTFYSDGVLTTNMTNLVTFTGGTWQVGQQGGVVGGASANDWWNGMISEIIIAYSIPTPQDVANFWTYANTYYGTNQSQIFLPRVSGIFTGSGAGITNIQASAITGTLVLNGPFMTNATAMSNLTVDATLNIRAISNTNSSPSIHFLNSNAVINATITASAASLTFAGSQPAALFQMSVFAPNLVAGFLYGNGAGLTALTATQLVGLVPLANLPPVVVTNGFGYTPLVVNNTLTVNSNVTVNGTMTASNMVFDTASFSTAVATNFYFYTNATSAWPAAPPAYGAAYVGNSNGVLYILTSFHNADGGYPTNIWTKTNLWAPQ